MWSRNTLLYEFFACAGIVTNYKEVKVFLQKKGYQFESDTDTEVIAKLVHHIYMHNPNCSFRELIEQVIQQLVCI
jgi:glucosamine--fructose-6-phosphate aminotransferase (isomerizing)